MPSRILESKPEQVALMLAPCPSWCCLTIKNCQCLHDVILYGVDDVVDCRDLAGLVKPLRFVWLFGDDLKTIGCKCLIHEVTPSAVGWCKCLNPMLCALKCITDDMDGQWVTLFHYHILHGLASWLLGQHPVNPYLDCSTV